MNDALTLPFFTQSSSSYPPTPPFPDNYEGTFTNNTDDFYSSGYDIDAHDAETNGIMTGTNGGPSDDRIRSNGTIGAIKRILKHDKLTPLPRPSIVSFPHPSSLRPHQRDL